MEKATTTLIIESRSLVREALASLLTNHSYRVIGGVASMADIAPSLPAKDVPRLVILGALAGDEAVRAADTVRKLWPTTKIVLLFDHASPADFQKLLTSEIDGCIPLFASQDTLLDTLKKLVAADFRILIQKPETRSSMPCATAGQLVAKPLDQARNNPAQSNPARSDETVRSDEPLNGTVNGAVNGTAGHTAPLGGSWGLSPREGEVLKGVAKGLSNKMIGRLCGTTDSTIKVHMKSILRKIRVQNRTQAAIWAVEHSY